MAVRNANDAISMVQTADGVAVKLVIFKECVNLQFKSHQELLLRLIEMH